MQEHTGWWNAWCCFGNHGYRGDACRFCFCCVICETRNDGKEGLPSGDSKESGNSRCGSNPFDSSSDSFSTSISNHFSIAHLFCWDFFSKKTLHRLTLLRHRFTTQSNTRQILRLH